MQHAVCHVRLKERQQIVVGFDFHALRFLTQNFLQPGLRYKPPYGALDLISLGMALIFGTAGLPHILVRFYTVPDAKTARVRNESCPGRRGSTAPAARASVTAHQEP